jgi:hypothetical protein
MVLLLLCESLLQFALWLFEPVMVAVMVTDCPTITLAALAASLRAEVGLRRLPADVKWVGDPRICRPLTDVLARASGRSPDYRQALATVRIGRFYLVRLGPVGEWLIGPDFRLVTTFVNQN